MVQHTKSASPATPGFDKEAFRKSLLTRSLNQTLSSRAAILPTNEPIVSSSSRCSTARAATERNSRPVVKNLEPTTPRTILQKRALTSRGEAGSELMSSVHNREGPSGLPISRLPERKWFQRQTKSARSYDTEYARTFCMDQPSEQLDKMLKMTFNDNIIQRETKVNIADFPRSELRTAVLGWGPRLRQIYVPELKTDSLKIHQHYLALGIPHEYQVADKQEEDAIESSDGNSKGTLIKPKTAPASRSRRPSIKAFDAGVTSQDDISSPRKQFDNSSSLTSTSRRMDGSPSMAATEYRGQYSNTRSMDGAIERTQVLLDGPIDFDQLDDLEQSKLLLRTRHSQSLEENNKYKELVYLSDAAKRFNITVDEAAKLEAAKAKRDVYGMQFNAPKRHRPAGAESPTRNIASLQKDLVWEPEEPILKSLTGKAGPSQLTAQRTGFYGIQQAHSPRQTLKWGDTRVDRESHYGLEVNDENQATVNVESQAMGLSPKSLSKPTKQDSQRIKAYNQIPDADGHVDDHFVRDQQSQDNDGLKNHQTSQLQNHDTGYSFKKLRPPPEPRVQRPTIRMITRSSVLNKP